MPEPCWSIGEGTPDKVHNASSIESPPMPTQKGEGSFLPGGDPSSRRGKKEKKNSKHVTSSARLLIGGERFDFCVAGHTECIEPLVQHGADVDQHIDRLGSPLHTACTNQHAGAARKLLQLGEEHGEAG